MDQLQKEVIEWLGNRSPLEMADIIRELEGKWGVKAAPVTTSVPGSGFPLPPTPDKIEQTEFTVVLASAGAKKIDVIKVVREVTGLGLKEAKDLVETAPKTLKESISKADAEELRTKLVAAGATVELK